MVFPPQPQVFTSGGLLDPSKTGEEKDSFDPNFGRKISGENSGSLNLINEDLNAHFGNLTINALMDAEGENYYLKKICPCLPEVELNNWTVEELPIIFKSNTEVPNINGVSNIIPYLQVDFDQNPRPVSSWPSSVDRVKTFIFPDLENGRVPSYLSRAG
ncbi:hypothetical protein GQ457_07G006740 [Hibiscus cannabinus]